MKIIISADGRKLCASTGGQPLTSGSVGIEAAFVLSADYDGLAVTVVFRAGDVSVDVLLTGPSCTVPWEVLETSGHVLIVGVVGKNGSGEIVIPTIWGRVGMIECGTVAEGIDPQDPTPDIAAQLLQIAQDTVARAETAETTATEAAEAAGESATAAGEAKTDAETAAQAAEAAKAEAEAAQAAAEVAQAKAEDAQGAAETAQAAAEVAQGKAEDAQGAAETAQAAAEVAQGKAEDAQGAAEVAQGKAEDAQGAAETAQQAAETARDAASSSATGASGSATTAAQQAQAAAAARAAAEAAQQAAEEAKTYAQTFTGAPRAAGSASQMTDTSLIYVYTGATSGTLTNGHWYYWDGSAWADGGVYNSTALQTDTTLTVSGAAADAKATGDAVDDLKSAVDQKAPAIYDTASGAIARFEDGADSMPLKQVLVDIEPVQAAGTPTPETPLPISGWTECNVTHTGKNLFDAFTGDSRGIKLEKNGDGQIVITGVAEQNIHFTADLPLNAGTYVFSGKSTQWSGIHLRLRNSSGEVFQDIQSDTDQRIFTLEKPTVLRRSITVEIGTDCTNGVIVSPMLEVGSTASAFEPYIGHVYPITFPTEAGTVYGGMLTINADGSGELASRSYYASYNGETLVGPWVSSMDVYAPGTTPTIGAQVVDLGGVETVYQLTASQITTLLGTNNVWADCGNVTVEYPVDTKLYIDAQPKNTRKLVVYNTAAEMQADFTKEKSVCYVLNDESTYCNGDRGNLYEYKETLEFGELTLANGGCAALIIPEFTPPKSNVECVGRIRDIAESYCGVGVPYVSSAGPFSSTNTGIQCSQFVNALLQGVYYQDSKLVSTNTANKRCDGFCRWIDLGDTIAFSANQLAHYAACHGWLFVTKKLKYTEPGDVLFFQDTSSTYMDVAWKGINHTGVVIARIGHKTLFVNAGSLYNTLNGIASYVNKPGQPDDAVRYYMLDDDETEAFSGTFGLYGFARFPVFYNAIPEISSIFETATGDVIKVTDGADAKVKSLLVSLANNSISLNGITVSKSGRNMIGGFKARIAPTGVTFTPKEDGSVILNGITTGSTQSASFKFWLPAGTYTIYGYPATSRDGHSDILVKKASDDSIVGRGYTGSTSASFTLESPTLLYYTIRETSTGVAFTNSAFYPMILRSDEEDTTFEAPMRKDVSISFPESVSNFNLDYTNGVLTDTDGGTEYNLMPFDLPTTKGVNYIWASVGTANVEYYADEKMYIAKQLIN